MHHSQFTIRKASIDDLDTLSHISRKSFYDSFADQNNPEDMDAYVSKAFNKARLRYEMSQPGSQFWLAEKGAEMVGYLKVNSGQAQSDIHDDAALEVERIYVLEKYQGNKIGFKLMKKAHEIAMEERLKYIWLGVWEKNKKAIRFYSRLGFRKIGEHTFMLGNDPQKDVLMRLDLNGVLEGKE